jgi:uncharacterized protein YjiS (DUF1127 family)
MATQSVSSHDVLPRKNVFAGPQAAASPRRGFIEMLAEWRRRTSSRRELALLSELDLKDLGHPARVEAEKAKPFWRP